MPEIGSNRLLREAGIAFGDDWHWGNGTFDATLRATGQLNAARLLALLDDASSATDDEKAKAGVTLGQLFAALPSGDPLLQQLDQRYNARINTINPTPNTPVSDAFDKALLQREAALLQAQDVYAVTVHRTLTDTYGHVAVSAPRISTTVTIDTSRTRFQFTGMYLPAGEVVTVTVPAALVGQGYRVQISTNTDNISARSDWRRVPDIDRNFPIDSSSVPIASAFGGAIIIDLRGSTYDANPANIGLQPITIEGAVEQPYFVLGQHTNQQWNDSLRHRPGVRAALVSTHTIITVPASYIETLDDPETLMAWWDDVTAGQDDLVGRLTPRTAAEIINVDIQNSAGAAHAGYPIQAWDIHWGNPLDPDVMRSGSWGDFHELGHNHQRGWWTFDGDGEVSVNIFSNFNLETDATHPDASSGWGYSTTPVTAIERAKSDLAGNPSYAENGNRWSFWFVLADVPGGWENFRCAFRTYENDEANNPAALPTTNADEQGQWLVRFSTCAGWDMSRMMVDTWGLSATQAQRDAVAALPDYMPIATVYTSDSAESNTPTLLPLTANAVAIDDTVTLVEFSDPANGTLQASGNGSVTYTSDVGFSGTDSFTYTLQSSADNTLVVTMTLDVFPCDNRLVVSNSADSGNCTLRDAVATAVNGDTITFHPRLDGQTIYLASTIAINSDITIDGGDIPITLSGDSDRDGNGDIQLLSINSNPVYLYNLNIMDGRSSSGAVIVTWNDHLVISNTTFANNVSTFYGGGAIHSQSRVSIYNSTFSNNQATGTGDALSLRNDNNAIVHSTFVSNGDGATIGLMNGTGWTLHNSIVSNTLGTACSGQLPTASGGNLVFDNTCDPTPRVVSSVPFLLGALQDSGGRLIHQLYAGSPAINRGVSAACLATDQLGNPRNDSACDAGSIEFVSAPTSVVRLSDQTAADSTRLLTLVILVQLLMTVAFAVYVRSKADGV